MVSIIIPIFNTDEELLQRCILSITEQEYQEFEILIVNDGSEVHYNSSVFSDERIKVLSIPHSGVSTARNKGILEAKGDYVAFVDGDDMITPSFLKEALQLVNQYNADFIIGGIQCVDYDGNPIMMEVDDKPYCFLHGLTTDIRRSHLNLEQQSIPWTVLGSPCGRLYKKKLLDGIYFNEQISYLEDQVFNREVLLKAENIVYLHHIWYIYFQYYKSSLHSIPNWKDAALNPEYLRAWNSLNIVEPDEKTRAELCVKGIHWFSAFVSYWIIPIHASLFSKVKSLKYRFQEQRIQEILLFCDRKRMSKRDFLLWLLLKYHLFYIFYGVLIIRNLAIKEEK